MTDWDRHNRLGEILSILDDLIIDAVIEQVDHPALPNLRGAYLATQVAFNMADSNLVHQVELPVARSRLRSTVDDVKWLACSWRARRRGRVRSQHWV